MLYIVLMLHPGLKIMPFKLTSYCRLRSKDGKFKPRRRRMQNVWLYSEQRQTRLQDISSRKAICSQLETLEKRAIIYNFIFNLFTLVIFMKVDNISSHC